MCRRQPVRSRREIVCCVEGFMLLVGVESNAEMVVSNRPRPLTTFSEFVIRIHSHSSSIKEKGRGFVAVYQELRVSLRPFDSKYSGYHRRYEDIANIAKRSAAALFTFFDIYIYIG